MTVVGEAADGNAAIAQAELLQPDVILLDLSMPHRTGLEALPRSTGSPAAKVIILSGFAASVIEDDLLAHGAAGYIQKGIDPDEILAAIETAATRRTPDSLRAPETTSDAAKPASQTKPRRPQRSTPTNQSAPKGRGPRSEPSGARGTNMGREGFEPSTLGLRVPCSTN